MDITAYEQELEERIEELKNEIDALRQEKIDTPEYEEDIQSDIRRCLTEIDEIEEELEAKEYLTWDNEKEGEQREWESSRI
jgi:peptidoglycan hydrolase CwlO-like protein